MKTIYKYIYASVLVTLILGVSSCKNEDFLEVENYTYLSYDYMFKSADNAEAGLIGLYDTFYPTKDNADEDDASLWALNHSLCWQTTLP